MANSKKDFEHPDNVTNKDLEDAIDMAIYQERKNGEYVSEEEVLEYLRHRGKL